MTSYVILFSQKVDSNPEDISVRNQLQEIDISLVEIRKEQKKMQEDYAKLKVKNLMQILIFCAFWPFLDTLTWEFGPIIDGTMCVY